MFETMMPKAPSPLWLAYDPDLSATAIALERGWIMDAFAQSDLSLRSARDLLSVDAWDAGDILYEGSNIPALWRHADRLHRGQPEPTSILGLTWVDETQRLLARPNLGLNTPIDLKALKGRTFGLPAGDGGHNLARAMALRAFHTVLTLAGLTYADIHIKDLDGIDEISPYVRAERALRNGEADVIYVRGPHAMTVQARHHFDIVLDLNHLKDPHHRINTNTPRVILASRNLIDNYPRQVQQHLRALVRAGRWAQETGPLRKSLPGLAPSLEAPHIQALQNQADFLFGESLIPALVDVRPWIDSQPLAAALLAESNG